MGTALSSKSEAPTFTTKVNQALYEKRFESKCKGKPFSVLDLTGNGEAKAIGIGRWLIWEDVSSGNLRFAFADQNWCLQFTPSGTIQGNLGNLRPGKACWSDVCQSTTWCTHYTKDGTNYADCQDPNIEDIKSRPGRDIVAYMDRLLINTVSVDGKSADVIEIYEDFNDKVLGNITGRSSTDARYLDNPKSERPVLVVSLNKKTVFAINPTSFNLREYTSPGLKEVYKRDPSGPFHSFNNCSNPHYLDVLYSAENTPRACDTAFSMGLVPDYKEKGQNDRLVTVNECTAAAVISSHWAMSCVLDTSERSPCTLWFAYCKGGINEWRKADTAIPNFGAAGLSMVDGDIYEGFNGNPIIESTVGESISCPDGYFVTRFCGSGKNSDCNGGGMQNSAARNTSNKPKVYGQIECKRVDRILSEKDSKTAESMIKDSSFLTPDRKWTSIDAWDRRCLNNEFLTGVCVSGENSDCNGSRGKVECSTYPELAFVNTTTDKLSGYHLTPELPSGTAATGICNGGSDASNCSNNAFGTLYYGNVQLVTPSTSTAKK